MTCYLTPTTVEEAMSTCSPPTPAGPRVIAGGTDVLPDIRKGKAAPPLCLVDITRIPALTEIRVGAGGYVTVGAAVTFAMLREHAYLCQHVHALVEAAASVGAALIQSAATWGGNLVQAMPAADGAISAIALGAELRVVDRDGERWIPGAATRSPAPDARTSTRQRQLITSHPLPESRRRRGAPPGARAGRRPSLILPDPQLRGQARAGRRWQPHHRCRHRHAAGSPPAHTALPKPKPI